MRCRAPATAGEGSAEAAAVEDGRPLRRLARAGSRSRCLATSETGPTKMESLIRAPLVTDNHQQELGAGEGAAPLSKKASSNFPCYKSRAVIIITFTVRSYLHARSFLFSFSFFQLQSNTSSEFVRHNNKDGTAVGRPLVKGRKTNAVYNKNGGELTVPSLPFLFSLSLCASLLSALLCCLLIRRYGNCMEMSERGEGP